MRMGATSFCVAGAALGALQARFAWQAQHLGHRRLFFAWQAQHLEHLRLFFAWQAQHLEHLRIVSRGRCSTWSTFLEVGGRVATSGANGRCLVLRTLGALQACFACQAQHLRHRRLVSPGRRSTWSTFLEVGGSLMATSDWAPPRFAWQASFEQCHRGRRKSGDE